MVEMTEEGKVEGVEWRRWGVSGYCKPPSPCPPTHPSPQCQCFQGVLLETESLQVALDFYFVSCKVLWRRKNFTQIEDNKAGCE